MHASRPARPARPPPSTSRRSPPAPPPGASPARAITCRRYSGSLEIRTVSSRSPGLGHPHQHRPAPMQIHPDDLPTLVRFAHRGLLESMDVSTPSMSRESRGAEAPLLHRINGSPKVDPLSGCRVGHHVPSTNAPPLCVRRPPRRQPDDHQAPGGHRDARSITESWTRTLDYRRAHGRPDQGSPAADLPAVEARGRRAHPLHCRTL